VSGRDESPHRRALADLSRDNPEWSGWLEVLGAAIERAEDPSWGDVRVTPNPSRLGDDPMLAGATVGIDGRALEQWIGDLLRTVARASDALAPLVSRRPPEAWDPVGFIEAAVSHHTKRIDDLAAAVGVPGDLLRGIAVPVTMPVLRACSRLPGDARDGWTHGYCPLCGAWPALAEARGLEGSRQLRCGRCGGDWRFDWLRCPYCGNAEHTALGALVSEAAGDMRKVETCHACRGYLKTVTTLTARAPTDVVIEDAATVPYDVAALEAGFTRPTTSGHSFTMSVEARRRSRLLGFRR
jgi:FdhE protein